MAFIKTCALSALALTLALTGCNDANKQNTTALAEDQESIIRQLDEQSSRLNELGAQLQRERDRADALAEQLAHCQEESASAPPPARLTLDDASEFSGIPGVEASKVGSDIHLTIASSLLFDSGRTTLKDSSRKSLDQVAARIKELYPTREILVVGHTDADPIRKSAYPTNYHLGFERAFKVREYLGKRGVQERNMALMSWGPSQPEATKERSRRVEIVVTGHDATGVASVRTEQPRNAGTAASKSSLKKKTTSPSK